MDQIAATAAEEKCQFFIAVCHGSNAGTVPDAGKTQQKIAETAHFSIAKPPGPWLRDQGQKGKGELICKARRY